MKYYISEPVIDVDFSQLNKDKTHYYWTERNQLEKIINHFDAKITVKAINPDTVLFAYDHQFIKKIPVTVLINPSFARPSKNLRFLRNQQRLVMTMEVTFSREIDKTKI